MPQVYADELGAEDGAAGRLRWPPFGDRGVSAAGYRLRGGCKGRASASSPHSGDSRLTYHPSDLLVRPSRSGNFVVGSSINGSSHIGVEIAYALFDLSAVNAFLLRSSKACL